MSACCPWALGVVESSCILLPSSRQRIRNGKLSLTGMPSIVVLFHISADKDFSHSGTMASHKSTGPVLVHSPVRAGL